MTDMDAHGDGGRMLDALLVIPPYYYKTKVLTSSVKEYAGVAYLAAILREKGFTVEILDADLAGYDAEETIAAVTSRKARVVGFTLLQVAAHFALDIIKRLRAAGLSSHIVLGGHFATFAAEEILLECSEIDSVVLGEGEYTFLELIRAVAGNEDWRGIDGLAYIKDGGCVFNPCRPLIKDLDSLPFQARDTLPEVLRRGGPAAVISSRGCYGNCAFCSVNAFYKKSPGSKWRGRSPENVADELELLVKNHHANIFVFNDDNFIGPGKNGKERARRIGEEILRRGLEIHFAIPAAVNDVELDLFRSLKEAGLRSVFLGIESMLQRDLEFLNKHTTVEQNEAAIATLEELGIFYQIGFILFYPYSTLEDVQHNIRYLKEKIIKNSYCGTQVFTGDLRILHGTPLESRYAGDKQVSRERFHYTYRIADTRVEKLRELLDQLILKKTFPLMVDCKEEFMGSSAKRWIRTLICEIQLSMALRVIELLEAEGDIGPAHLKTIIRDLNRELTYLHQKIAVIKGRTDELELAPHPKCA